MKKKPIPFLFFINLGAGRAVTDAFLRLVYKRPVPSKPVLDLSLHDIREGFMDIILDIWKQ